MGTGDIERILELNCIGDDVKTLQTILEIEITGFYNEKTKQAVEDYQIKNMLEVNGKVTPELAMQMICESISACTDESLEALEKEYENKFLNFDNNE